MDLPREACIGSNVAHELYHRPATGAVLFGHKSVASTRVAWIGDTDVPSTQCTVVFLRRVRIQVSACLVAAMATNQGVGTISMSTSNINIMSTAAVLARQK